MGVFDKFNGRSKRLRLIGQKKLRQLKQAQAENRQQIVFRQHRDRSTLQKKIEQQRQAHYQEREKLAKQIYWFRTNKPIQEAEQIQAREGIKQEFKRSSLDLQKKQGRDTNKNNEDVAKHNGKNRERNLER